MDSLGLGDRRTQVLLGSPGGTCCGDASGTVDVSVTNSIGSGTLEDAFTYVAPHGTVMGYGQTVTGMIPQWATADSHTFESTEGITHEP